MATIELITVADLLAKASDNEPFRERLHAMLGDGWDSDVTRTVRVEFEDEDRDFKFAIISWH